MKRVLPLGLGLLALACGSTEKPAGPNASGGQGIAGASSSTAGSNASGNGGSNNGVAGAGGASGGSSGGSLNPIGVVLGDTPAEACIAYGWAVCARREACRDGQQGISNCTYSTLNCPDLSFSPGATRTPAVLKECAATYATLPCDQVRAEKLPTCVTPGTRLRGEECIFASQCSSLSCSFSNSSGDLCGSCGVRAAKGESCAGADVDCEVGTECNPANSLCEEPPVVTFPPIPGANEACTFEVGCLGDYYCKADGLGGGVCTAQAKANDSCAEAPCVYGNYCSTDSLCKPYPLPGQPCGFDKSGSLICDGRGFCDPAPGSTSGTCKPAPKAGEPCIASASDNPTRNYCPTVGLHCDTTATPPVCKGPGKAGEMCFTQNDCLGLSSCECDDLLAAECTLKHCTELHVANQPCTAPNTRCHPAFECIAGICQPLTLRGDFTAACGPP